MSTAVIDKLTNPAELEILRKSVLDEQQQVQTTVVVCGGTGCQAYGSADSLYLPSHYGGVGGSRSAEDD